MKMRVEGIFTAVIEAENGKEIDEILKKVKKPNNTEVLILEAEELWPEGD